MRPRAHITRVVGARFEGHDYVTFRIGFLVAAIASTVLFSFVAVLSWPW